MFYDCEGKETRYRSGPCRVAQADEPPLRSPAPYRTPTPPAAPEQRLWSAAAVLTPTITRHPVANKASYNQDQ